MGHRPACVQDLQRQEHGEQGWCLPCDWVSPVWIEPLSYWFYVPVRRPTWKMPVGPCREDWWRLGENTKDIIWYNLNNIICFPRWLWHKLWAIRRCFDNGFALGQLLAVFYIICVIHLVFLEMNIAADDVLSGEQWTVRTKQRAQDRKVRFNPQ